MNAPLASHLCGALHGRDLVLLDLASGAYELLAGVADGLQLRDNGRILHGEDHALFEALAEMGVLAEAPSVVGRPLAAHPCRSRPTLTLAPPTIADRLWMAKGWVGMLHGYHGRSFQHLLSQARAHRVGPAGSVDAPGVYRRAEVFDRLSVWTPFQGECLYRCAMLLRLLGPRGQAVDWVFGVRTWPFVAHCWLQLDDVALTDPAERLAMFTPLLVL